MGFETESYERHQKSFDEARSEKELAKYKNWFDVKTTDLWRHQRMLSVLDPFLKHEAGAFWLTVGDGRFGTSATYISTHGGKALASDIDVRRLEQAKQHHLLHDYRYANAEQLPFADEQFDYAYCKQAYHHFQRPALAIYEMLRVARRAIILTEPNDFVPPPLTRAVLQRTKHFLKRLTGKKISHHDAGNYEPIGNYIYSISVRDFEKMALGLNLPAIAYKRFYDIYFDGVENEPFSSKAPLYRKIKSRIAVGKIKTWLGINYPNNIQMIVFKSLPSNEILKSLKADGYTFVELASNPYV